MMYRQSPSRNQRSKGISVKYFVQYSLLLGVCFWLLYELKHSREKNLQHQKSEPERLHVDEIMKLGRKGIQDRFEETAVFEAKIEETSGEEDDSNFEGGTGGVEETDKNERDESSDSDEEMIDDEKLREAVDDENEVEEDTEQEEENVPEVREDNYKADDVSSAVTHDSQRRATENENESSEDIEHHETDIVNRNGHDISEETTKKDTLRDLEGEVNGDELENANESSEDNEHAETDLENRNDHDISEETTKKDTIRDLEVEVNGSENGDELGNENSKSIVTEGSGNLLIGNNSTDLAIGNETVKNATGSASEDNEEMENLEPKFEDGSNSTVSTETTDNLDETVEEDMDANEVSNTILIEDNSTSKTNGEDEESEREDKDGTEDDTDIPERDDRYY